MIFNKIIELIMNLSPSMTIEEWKEVYKKIVDYEIRFQSLNETIFNNTILSLKEEANEVFAKYFTHYYPDWLSEAETTAITFSHTLLKKHLFPHLDNNSRVFFILIDNLRYDQWVMFKPILKNIFK